MASVNSGHRQRLRERMMKDGIAGFADHEVLEMLLFQYLPRRDTNKIAHNLLNKFGTFANVLNASPKELMMVDGISEVTASNLAMLKEVFQRYKKSQADKIPLSDVSSVIRYSRQLIGESYIEKLVVVYVNSATEFLYREQYTSDSTDKVHVDVKAIVSTAVRCGASGVLLFHCHVDGPCVPSDGDVAFTEKLFFRAQQYRRRYAGPPDFQRQRRLLQFLQKRIVGCYGGEVPRHMRLMDKGAYRRIV